MKNVKGKKTDGVRRSVNDHNFVVIKCISLYY